MDTLGMSLGVCYIDYEITRSSLWKEEKIRGTLFTKQFLFVSNYAVNRFNLKNLSTVDNKRPVIYPLAAVHPFARWSLVIVKSKIDRFEAVTTIFSLRNSRETIGGQRLGRYASESSSGIFCQVTGVITTCVRVSISVPRKYRVVLCETGSPSFLERLPTPPVEISFRYRESSMTRVYVHTCQTPPKIYISFVKDKEKLADPDMHYRPCSLDLFAYRAGYRG